MAHVSVRYDATTGQPLVVRVAEDDAPPLVAEPGEAVAVTTIEEYKKAKSDAEFLKKVHPKVAGYYNQIETAQAQYMAEVEAQAQLDALATESDPTA